MPPPGARSCPRSSIARTRASNNRAENSHLPLRRREQAMQGFRSPAGLQRFITVSQSIRDKLRRALTRMSGKSGVHLGLSFPEDFDVCRKSLTINDEDTARYPAVGAMTNTNSKRLTFQRIPHRPTSVLATANCWHVRSLQGRIRPAIIDGLRAMKARNLHTQPHSL